MSNHLNELGNNLLGILADKSDDVVLKCISVLAEVVNSQNSLGNGKKIFYFILSKINFYFLYFLLYFEGSENFHKAHYRKFLQNLVNLFSGDKCFLDNRASLIIRLFMNIDKITSAWLIRIFLFSKKSIFTSYVLF